MIRFGDALSEGKDNEWSATFTCVACGGVFLKAWSDEEADAEFLESFLSCAPEDAVLVCDPCWHQMRSRNPELDAHYAV